MSDQDRQYPVQPLYEKEDPRFTFGLILDVSDVLVKWGYPDITSGADHVRLQQALFLFAYGVDDGDRF